MGLALVIAAGFAAGVVNALYVRDTFGGEALAALHFAATAASLMWAGQCETR